MDVAVALSTTLGLSIQNGVQVKNQFIVTREKRWDVNAIPLRLTFTLHKE